QGLLRILAIELPRHRRAHAVTNENGALDLRIAHHRINRARKVIHAVSNLWLIALTMAGKIDCDYPIALRKVRELSAPVVDVASPPMYQHQRLVAFTIIDIVYARAIEFCETRLGSCRAFGVERVP